MADNGSAILLLQCLSSLYCSSGVAVAGIALSGIVTYVVYQLYLHPLAKYPGPLLARLTQWYDVYHSFIGDRHVLFHELHRKYGTVVRFAPNALSINDPIALKAVYGHNANVQKSTFYKCFRSAPTAVSTLLATEKQHHARKRRVMGQAFSDHAMRGLEQYVLGHVQALIEKIEQLTPKASGVAEGDRWSAPQNMAKWCNWLVFDIMGDLVFGRSFGTLGERPENRRGIFLLGRAARRNYTVAAMPFLVSTGLEKYLPFLRGLYLDRNQYLAFGKKQVMERAERDKAEKGSGSTQPERQDIFSFLLSARDPESGEGMPMNELFMEGNTLIVAGSDTTSTTLSAAIFYLLNNPAILARLTTEIRSKFVDPGEIYMSAQMHECVLLRACIDETLRMSPAVSGLLPREVLKGGLSIPSLDMHIPEGVVVGVPIYAIQHHASYISDPFTFAPDRWLSGKASSTAAREALQSCFTPFLIGNRACLGKPLVYMELSIALARLVFEFDIRKAPEDVQPHRSIGAYLPGLEQPPSTRNIARDVQNGKRNPDEYHLLDWFMSHNEGPLAEFRRHKRS